MYLFYASKLCSVLKAVFFFQVHLETTGEAAGINKEKKTETNLAGSCCEPFQCDGLFSGEFVILCYKKGLKSWRD